MNTKLFSKIISGFLLLVLLFFSYASSVNATLVRSPPINDRTFYFSPGLEKEYTIYIGGASSLSMSTYGPLKEYFNIEDPDPYGGPRNVKIKIKLPSALEPGFYENTVHVVENTETGGTVGGVAAIGVLFRVISLYPGEYVKYEFKTFDTNIGEDSKFRFTINNWGQEDISILYGKADVFDSEGNKVGTARTKITSLTSTEEKILEANFSTDGLTPGIYTAKSTVFYDGNNKTGENDNFRIGSPNIFINNWTQELYPDAINKFDIKIESDWGNDIEDVYGIITLKTENGDIHSKTPTIGLEKFQKKTLEGYINTKGLDFGEYDVNLKVFYLNTNTKKDVKVSVIKGEIPEGQKYKGVTITLSVTSLLLIILILIVIGNISYFAYKIMKNRKKK